jgi:hypothetical protein
MPRLRVCLVLLAWLAQLCLPLAHAAMMGAPQSQMADWCGDPFRAPAFKAYLAELPAELRQGMDEPGASAHALDACAKLCAAATTPPPVAAVAATVALRAVGLEAAPLFGLALVVSESAPRPPAQGPPARP